MPTYSYRCSDCDTAFDIHQAFTDDSLTVCPTCGGRLRKVFSAVGVSFNGSGFYRNDSRSTTKSTESASSSESTSSSGSTSSGSSSSESAKSSEPTKSSGSTSTATPSAAASAPAAKSTPSSGSTT